MGFKIISRLASFLFLANFYPPQKGFIWFVKSTLIISLAGSLLISPESAGACGWAGDGEADNEKAQHSLGQMYLEGRGMAPDKNQASKWISKSAQNGHVSAMKKIANMFWEGQMVLNKNFVSDVKKKAKVTDTILLICRSGVRSALAVNILAKAGFKKT